MLVNFIIHLRWNSCYLIENSTNEKCRPKIPTSSQTLLNEIQFRIKLKVSERKLPAKNSYIFSYSPQRNSIYNQIDSFWMKMQAKNSYIFSNSSQRNSI